MDAEKWLEANTFRCPIGRVTPAQCEALRARPVFNPARPLSGPYKPKECMECKQWREKMNTLDGKLADEPASQAAKPATKKCSKCGKEKPLEAFARDKYTRDGLTCRCKECIRLANKERRRKTRQSIKGKNEAPASSAESGRPAPGSEEQPEPAVARKALPASSAESGRRCSLCRRRLDWYDGEQGIGFVMEHYVLPAGLVCITCFSRLYGMQGFEEG